MEILNIRNLNNEILSAYMFVPQEPMRYIAVVCHGFRGAKENGGRICGLARQLNKLGLGVLAFDFSGSGQSEGDFSCVTLSRQASDLRSVIDYVDSSYHLPLILLGRSFGGSTILAGGAQDTRVTGYILWSTPVFMEETFARIMPQEYQCMVNGEAVSIFDEMGQYSLSPGFVEDLRQHEMSNYLQAIGERPVLIIQASDDEVVNPTNAHYMKTVLKNVQLDIVDNAGHRFLEKTVIRESISIEWLKEKIL